jgi:hypothetical protein
MEIDSSFCERRTVYCGKVVMRRMQTNWKEQAVFCENAWLRFMLAVV